MGSVSHSRVESYNQCKRKEYYSYGMKIARLKVSAALSLGTTGHALLQVLYSTVLAAGPSKAAQKAAYPAAVEAMLAEMDRLYSSGEWEDKPKRATLREIINAYLEREPFIDNAWSNDRRQWQILAVEKEFNFEYLPNEDPEQAGRYPFVVDLIARSPFGKVVIIDHKLVYDLYNDDKVALMPQLPKYVGALRALGFPADEALYNMLRTRPAPVKTKREPEDWTRTLPVEVTLTRVMRTMEEQVEMAFELEELDDLDDEQRDARAVRSAAGSDICQRMCDFRQICVEQLRGGNTEILMRTVYGPKPKREPIAVTQTEDEEE